MQTVVNYQQEGIIGPFQEVLLVSSSPRRHQLLHFLAPTIVQATADERAIEAHYMNAFADDSFLERAAKTCCEISKAKCDLPLKDGQLAVAADTIVICNGQIYNKPVDLEEARQMLRSYFGQTHHVVTSVCLKTTQGFEVFYTVAAVTFVQWYPELAPVLEAYVTEKSPLDKSGAYGIQELDPRFVATIEGDIHTIIGLPIAEISLRLFSPHRLEGGASL